MSTNSFGTRTMARLAGEPVDIFSLPALERAGYSGVSSLPYSLKVLLENLLRHEDERFVCSNDIQALAGWKPGAQLQKEISFAPARVLLQDFTGVPCVVDLAAMRDAMQQLGGDPALINPLQPVELVIDHSVQVDEFGTASAFDVPSIRSVSESRRIRCRFLGSSTVSNRICSPMKAVVIAR